MQVKVPKQAKQVVGFDLTERAFLDLIHERPCQECYELHRPPPPPPTHTPHSKALEAKLLSLGGERACVFDIDHKTDPDAFIEVLLGFGRVSSGKDARLRAMEPSNCHENAVKLAQKYPHLYQRETGYALGPGDGTWRRHSWAFDGRKNQIVETTELRDKYFGFADAL